MSGANRAPSTQAVRDDRPGGDHAREPYRLSRISIAVLLATTVAFAGALLVVRWHAPHHPRTVLLELLGFPVLILLAVILGRRRRAGGG